MTMLRLLKLPKVKDWLNWCMRLPKRSLDRKVLLIEELTVMVVISLLYEESDIIALIVQISVSTKENWIESVECVVLY